MLESLFLTINTLMTDRFAFAVAGCLLWGLVSVLFSPCHLASLPLIVGYVAGQGKLIQGREAAKYALAFGFGLFMTIAAVGLACSLLGRMLGDIGPYWTIPMGAVLVWVALDMFGVVQCALPSGLPGRLRVKGLWGALLLGLAYGVLSGTCTFGFLAPILAVITVQKKIMAGVALVVAFAAGHCLPLVVAGSSTALVQRWLETRSMRDGAPWFRKAAAGLVALLGAYFLIKPLVD
ncbi:cytochrome c biogenesis CcdA family protein [Fundidesulfovibrio butyratiphilus]